MKLEKIGLLADVNGIYTIKEITGLEKKVVVYIYKDGVRFLDFSFNRLTDYGNSLSFKLDGGLPLTFKKSFFKDNLKFDFATEHVKFYNLHI